VFLRRDLRQWADYFANPSLHLTCASLRLSHAGELKRWASWPRSRQSA